jgi:hypothetical protein
VISAGKVKLLFNSADYDWIIEQMLHKRANFDAIVHEEPPTDKGFSKLSLPVLRLLSVQMSELMSEDRIPSLTKPAFHAKIHPVSKEV